MLPPRLRQLVPLRARPSLHRERPMQAAQPSGFNRRLSPYVRNAEDKCCTTCRNKRQRRYDYSAYRCGSHDPRPLTRSLARQHPQVGACADLFRSSSPPNRPSHRSIVLTNAHRGATWTFWTGSDSACSNVSFRQCAPKARITCGGRCYRAAAKIASIGADVNRWRAHPMQKFNDLS